jgi:hypothetical protein
VTAPLVFKDAREWGELVARLFSGDAPAEIVPPGIILGSDRPEWAVLRGEIPWHHSLTQAALAANFSIVGITQPANDRVTVLEAIWLINDTATNQNYRIGLTTGLVFASQSKAASRDLRRLSLVTAGGLLTQAGDPLPSVRRFAVPTVTSVILPIPRGWMLSNNDGSQTSQLLVSSDVVNQSVTAYFFGYERRLRPEERRLD